MLIFLYDISRFQSKPIRISPFLCLIRTIFTRTPCRTTRSKS